jgi:tRNA threonylcarbamoyl adenosine modification protein YeaZ
MILLALDTSTTRGSVALLRDNDALASETFERARAGDGLFDAVDAVLRRASASPSQIEMFAVGLGPGSFTGIRAAIAAARGLALPGKRPIKGVSSFDAIALTGLPKMPDDATGLCVQCDARRGELYYAIYDRDGEPRGGCRIGSVEIETGTWVISPDTGFYPDAAMVGRLALLHGSDRLDPIYLRAPDYRQSGNSTPHSAATILLP